jgi:phosphoserine aminotransferase
MNTSAITTPTLNFSAGPAILPAEVIAQAGLDLIDLDNTGIGVLEHSHRGAAITRVFEEAQNDCRKVGGIPDDFEVLFLQGGASTQFGMIPMNFLPAGKSADYVDTGSWTNKAIKDANTVGTTNVVWSGKESGYRRIPTSDNLTWNSDAAYSYYCTNNTIYGTRWNEAPRTDTPLICDMSSDMFSRPIEWDRHAMVFAGAQKNIGPAGTTLAIIRKDFLGTAQSNMPSMLRYGVHADKGSMYNTPPVFAVYCSGLVFKWILSLGGLSEMEKLNDRKAATIYNAIDSSDGFFTGHADIAARSTMNITFTSPSPELDAAFIAAAADAGMVNIKGHRSVGGIRASVYNAFPEHGCNTLATFMQKFAADNRS